MELTMEIEKAVWDHYISLSSSPVSAKMGTLNFHEMILNDIAATKSLDLLEKFIYHAFVHSNPPPSHSFITTNATALFHRWKNRFKTAGYQQDLGLWIFNQTPSDAASRPGIAEEIFLDTAMPFNLRKQAAQSFEFFSLDPQDVLHTVEHCALTGRFDGLRQIFGVYDLTLESSRVMQGAFKSLNDMDTKFLPFWAANLVDYDDEFIKKLYNVRSHMLGSVWSRELEDKLKDINEAIAIFLDNWS